MCPVIAQREVKGRGREVVRVRVVDSAYPNLCTVIIRTPGCIVSAESAGLRVVTLQDLELGGLDEIWGHVEGREGCLGHAGARLGGVDSGIVGRYARYMSSIMSLETPWNQGRRVRIYRSTRNPMQAGAQHPMIWKMDWEITPNGDRWTNPIMGWASSGDAMQAMYLSFPNRQSAIEFAERHAYVYTVEPDLKTECHVKSYSDNYRFQTMNPLNRHPILHSPTVYTTHTRRIQPGASTSVHTTQDAGLSGDGPLNNGIWDIGERETIMSPRNVSEPKRVSVEEWRRRCEQIGVSRDHLNAMVLNFLMVEGYQEASMKFIEEARLPIPCGLEQMQERIEILNAIYQGNVRLAIEKINELDSELLDTRPAIHFMLLRLELIELMRTVINSPDADVAPILEFATVHLAPLAPSNPAFLEDLESAMALLCFSSHNVTPALTPLLDLSLRKTVASHVNAAILETQGLMQESRIETLLRLWGWSQKKLRQDLEFPSFDFTTTD
ncbi:hypothetical protein PCK1_001180 [Pneumocystis canis]|nr:hypothetical protein PCK1_001180 [Pneumocystis canis]